MNTSSKSSKKNASEKNITTKAGAPIIQESRMPNESIIKVVNKRITYTSMWKAIQKIAHPISFESLKQFYKL